MSPDSFVTYVPDRSNPPNKRLERTDIRTCANVLASGVGRSAARRYTYSD